MTTVKKKWNTPKLESIENEQINDKIKVFACSKYSVGCHPSNTFLDSIPGFKPEIM